MVPSGHVLSWWLSGASYKGTNPIIRLHVHTLITPGGSPLIPSHGGLGFHTQILGDTVTAGARPEVELLGDGMTDLHRHAAYRNRYL